MDLWKSSSPFSFNQIKRLTLLNLTEFSGGILRLISSCDQLVTLGCSLVSGRLTSGLISKKRKPLIGWSDLKFVSYLHVMSDEKKLKMLGILHDIKNM